MIQTEYNSIADDQAIDIEVVRACGKACEGMGRAIDGLSRLKLAADDRPSQLKLASEAHEIAVQLKYLTKSLGWMLRTVSDKHSPSIESGRSNVKPRFPSKEA